jgi:uncharacterized protein DUF4410
VNFLRVAIGLGFVLLLGGCFNTEQPALVTEPGVSLSTYKSSQVAPATNETGQTFDFDFATAFTQDLTAALQAKGYSVVDASAPGVLVVQCSFVSYAPGNAFQRWLLPGLGESQATVKTTLADGKSGEPVADVVTTETVTGGFFGGIGGYSSVLQTVANDVATAIDNKMKGS